MRMPAICKNVTLLFFLLWLALFSIEAQAAIDPNGVLDNALERYSTAAAGWSAIITQRASWLFWTLVVISMVWTFGFMALRKADIGEFFAEFIRFTIFTGFFWWLLTNGPTFANDIMRSLRNLGGNASGTGSELTPSGIVNIGLDIFFKVVDQSSLMAPVDSAVGIIVSAVILIILGLIGVNMLLLLVSSWILAYAGVFFLGFGGSRWTSDMAINYYKTVLNIAAQLFTMVLLVGIGKSFVDHYYNAMEVNINLKELGVMLIVSVVLLALVNKLPAMIGALAMGGGTYALGSGYGTGTAMGAAAVAGAAMATGGAAILAGGASLGGGAQALMAAYSKAAGSSSGASDGMGSMATAAAGLGGTNSGGGSVFASLDNATSGNGFSSSRDSRGSGGGFGRSAAESGNSGEKVNASASQGKDSGSKEGADGQSKSDAGGKPTGSDAKVGGSGNGLPPGEQRSSGSVLGRAAAIVAGTAGNLALGTWDVAKTKAASMHESALDRIGETTGGKIAAAIRARDAQAPASHSAAPTDAAFNNNELSVGKIQAEPSAASEVADFVNRGAKTS
jgi:type IV secretion system protein TrbL